MKPIVISLSPNVFAADIRLALQVLVQPWRWFRGPETAALEAALVARVGGEAITFDSGRVGWFVLLQALGVGSGDEVVIQAPTCVVVPNSVRWCGATPVYADADPQTCNLDPRHLAQKITPRTRVVMVQHTFGVAADLAAIRALTADKGIVLIEDCAHALGGTWTDADGAERPLGSVGAAAFFSFGRDKVISSVYGGAAVTRDPALAAKLRAYRDTLRYPSAGWVIQQLLHPILTGLVLPFYGYKAGRALLAVFQQLRLLSKAVYPGERRGRRHPSMPRRLPNALAILALAQLERLDAFNDRRRAVATRYRAALDSAAIGHPVVGPQTTPVYLRYTIQVPDAAGLLEAGRRAGIYLGDWYRGVLAPTGSDLAEAGYTAGDCPAAERLTTGMVNLPTHPTLTDADVGRVIDLVHQHLRETHAHQTH
jgi:dTDP-4-amino-4,6-dideoxygalactose transaminase